MKYYFFSLLIYRETDGLWSHLIPFKFSVNLLTSLYFPPPAMETDHCHLFLPNWVLVPCQPLFPLPVLFPTGNRYLKSRTRTQTNVCLTNFFLALVLPAGVFDTRPADYVFMLLFNWICIVVSFVCLQKAEHSWLNDCVALHQQMFVSP